MSEERERLARELAGGTVTIGQPMTPLSPEDHVRNMEGEARSNREDLHVYDPFQGVRRRCNQNYSRQAVVGSLIASGLLLFIGLLAAIALR